MNRSIASKVAFISLILLPLLLMPLPMRAFATPFDAARVPADADGVGHLDMDALRATTLHRLVTPKVLNGSQWKEIDARARPLAHTLLDVAQGVTFWLADRDSGALIVQVPDGKRIQSLLDKVPHKGDVRVAGHVARRYHFSKEKDQGDDNLIAMAGNLLISADSEANLARAINAATGKARNLAATHSVPDAALERGVFFFTALNDRLLDKVKDAAQSKTLRLNMTGLTVHVREVSAELRVRAKLMMGSAEQANKIKSMVDGVLALASVSDEADQLRPLTKGFALSVNGKALELSLAIPSAELVHFIETHN